MTGASVHDRLRAFEGLRLERVQRASDAVNAAAIRQWAEVIGDRNPVYADEGAARATGRSGIVAPPAMLQVWTMPGYRATVEGTRYDERWQALRDLLAGAGYEAIVATDCRYEIEREVELGERLAHTETIESISAEKRTALGHGFFVTTVQRHVDGRGDEVGRVTFRVLIYRPAEAGGAEERRPRPPESRDAAFWWEGMREGRLLIQRCADCATPRHPPGPMCPRCRSLAWDAVEAGGAGTLYSFVVNHHPKPPGFRYPLAVGLVELDEGVRLVAGVVGAEPAELRIGSRVELELFSPDPDLTLPRFRVIAEEGAR